jgi:hypothetical protein
MAVSTLNAVVKKPKEVTTSVDLSQAAEITETFTTEETGTVLAAWFKQAHENVASTDGNHLKEKALHITACLGITNFPASNGWIDRFKRRPDIVYRIVLGESRSVASETVEAWNSYQLLQKIRFLRRYFP